MNRPHRFLGFLITLLILKGMLGAWAPLIAADPAHAAVSHDAAPLSQSDTTACQLHCEEAQMQAISAASNPPPLEVARTLSRWVVAPTIDCSISPGLRPPIA
ncbi:MAG TPA: hypothetical protein VEG36_10250 [Burkholderiales bacterium]|nr:hypothetical protein [Burkholderiales bacterium]